MNLKKVKPRVKAMLEQYPLTRDNDNELVTRIWEQDMRDKGMDFFQALRLNMLTSYKSIVRVRAALQNIYPELKAKTEFRKLVEEPKVREELRTLNN